MNDNLIKLAEDAGFSIDKYGLFWNEDANSDGVDLEEFAKSIVKTCIVLIQYDIIRNGHTPENQRSGEHIGKISKYFDVDYEYSREEKELYDNILEWMSNERKNQRTDTGSRFPQV